MSNWTERNWTEDASHENGNYECQCVECGLMFIGHKRRVLCKRCSNLLAPALRSEVRSGDALALADKLAAAPLDQMHAEWPTVVPIRLSETERELAVNILRRAAQASPGWIDQNHQIDRYGVALMMIREGCDDPAGLARRILSEFEASPVPSASLGSAAISGLSEAQRKLDASVSPSQATEYVRKERERNDNRDQPYPAPRDGFINDYD